MRRQFHDGHIRLPLELSEGSGVTGEQKEPEGAAGGVAETGIGALRGRTFSATKVPAPTRDVRYPSDFSRSNVATTVPRDTRYCLARSRVDGRRVDEERRPSTIAARSSPYSQTDRG